MSSSQTNKISKWTIEEYLVFIYLSIADADVHVSNEELLVVTTKLKQLLTSHFPAIETDLDFLTGTLMKSLEVKTEEDKKNILILLNKQYPLSPILQKHIVNDLKELIHSDELATLCEFEMLSFIRQCFAQKNTDG